MAVRCKTKVAQWAPSTHRTTISGELTSATPRVAAAVWVVGVLCPNRPAWPSSYFVWVAWLPGAADGKLLLVRVGSFADATPGPVLFYRRIARVIALMRET